MYMNKTCTKYVDRYMFMYRYIHVHIYEHEHENEHEHEMNIDMNMNITRTLTWMWTWTWAWTETVDSNRKRTQYVYLHVMNPFKRAWKVCEPLTCSCMYSTCAWLWTFTTFAINKNVSLWFVWSKSKCLCGI
jgi:hypothetical protein